MTLSLPFQRMLLALLAASIVVSLAIAAADLTWHLAGQVDTEGGGMAAPVRSTARTQVDLAPVLALAPFGSAAAPTQAAPKETTLGLVLLGVVLADPPSGSTAVIAASGGEPHVYGIGDALPGSAVLESVSSDSVTLRIGGRLETLSFPKTPQVASGVAAIRAAIPTSAGGGPVPTVPGAPLSNRRDPAAIAEDYRQRIASNPQTVLSDVGLSATTEGYRLEETMMPDLRRAGLQPGDVVVRVNGNKVGNVEKDRNLFDDVVASGRARVEVMRNGDLIVLSFPLR